MDKNPIIEVEPVGFPWPTQDPFLFCVHHRDDYPAGTERMGPDPALLRGRPLGQDFTLRDGFRMYHGDVVPGFPRHPHRGFETVTLLTRGYCDHSDSLGATARFGPGDAQWMTAGRGIEHAEMFPLRERESDNPLELFQIWLNLPARSKKVYPHFSMLWRDAIPRHVSTDEAGRETEAVFVAGAPDGMRAPAPPPDSYANDPEADIAIWLLHLSGEARFTLPAARQGTCRAVYCYRGEAVMTGDQALPTSHRALLRAEPPVEFVAGGDGADLLLLQGRPIGEPLARQGPFVMNTPAEIREAFMDYHSTRFGQYWPWSDDAPVHPREEGRFARHADGRLERPESP